jgi:hypothetical protein
MPYHEYYAIIPSGVRRILRLAVLWLFGAFAVSFGVLFPMFTLRLRGLIAVRSAPPQHMGEGIAQEQGEQP